MSRLSIRLPETLHQELTNEAKDEGVSLNQYVVYLLARRHEDRYPLERVPDLEVAQQLDRFEALMAELGPAASTEDALATLREIRKPAAPRSGTTENSSSSVRAGKRRHKRSLQP